MRWPAEQLDGAVPATRMLRTMRYVSTRAAALEAVGRRFAPQKGAPEKDPSEGTCSCLLSPFPQSLLPAAGHRCFPLQSPAGLILDPALPIVCRIPYRPLTDRHNPTC